MPEEHAEINTLLSDLSKQDLETSWNGSIEIVDDEKFRLHKEVDNGRKIDVIISFDPDRTKRYSQLDSIFGPKRNAVYKTESLTITGQSGEKQDLLEMLPEGVDILLEVREGDKPGKRRNERNWFSIGENAVFFDRIDNMQDVFTLVHEIGHAVVLNNLNPDERETRSSARIVRSEGSKFLEVSDLVGLKRIEDEYEMSIQEAWSIVKTDEYQANEIVDAFIDKNAIRFEIAEDEIAEEKRMRQSNYQTYDTGRFAGELLSILFEGASLSERSTQIRSINPQALNEHYALTTKIIQTYLDKFDDRDYLDVFTQTGENIKISFNGSFVNVTTYRGNGEVESFHISYAHVTRLAWNDNINRMLSEFSLRSFEDAERTMDNLAGLVEGEQKVLEILLTNS